MAEFPWGAFYHLWLVVSTVKVSTEQQGWRGRRDRLREQPRKGHGASRGGSWEMDPELEATPS